MILIKPAGRWDEEEMPIKSPSYDESCTYNFHSTRRFTSSSVISRQGSGDPKILVASSYRNVSSCIKSPCPVLPVHKVSSFNKTLSRHPRPVLPGFSADFVAIRAG